MSKTTSPQRFGEGMDHYYDPNFTADISQKMRVPKRIKVGGSGDDDVTAPTVGPVPDKFEMHVPDRILVAGQEQHIGTRAPPRELILENSVMPPDPGLIRVQTPPRVITLDEYSFPSADDAPTIPDREEKFVSLPHPKSKFNTDHRLLARGDTPPIGGGGEGLTPAEEVLHLRKQMAKLNRRVMAIELDNLQRQQREKFLCALGLAYFFLKTVLWLSRSS
ncbi:hypothetical protein R5R35_008535 [Gryllus longicercus]|uniref:Mff-like domain-containing protein n=1 Tax=Gryllus longicercus TaxID=2509291 RepID=A0AAN9VJG9_9ORTH